MNTAYLIVTIAAIIINGLSGIAALAHFAPIMPGMSAAGVPVSWLRFPIGTLKVKLDDKVLFERPLIALSDGDEGGFFKRFSDGVWMWFKGDAGANVSAAAPKAN